METESVPLNTWLVAEPAPANQVKPISTHATQTEAEGERDRRNAELGKSVYWVCRLVEPVAARLGCAARHG